MAAAANAPEATSLLGLVKNEILTTVIDYVAGISQSQDGWRVLVVDEPALKLISSCCRMSDVMEHGITLGKTSARHESLWLSSKLSTS